jgi:hypothetical protein
MGSHGARHLCEAVGPSSHTLQKVKLQSGLLALLATAAALGGCGGSGTTSTSSAATDSTALSSGRPESAAERAGYVKRAEAICARSVREARTLRRSLPTVISHSSSAEEGITNGFVKPGIGILSRESARLRMLKPKPTSGALGSYLGLFEPILALARQRLQTGKIMDAERGHALELLIDGLASEQSTLAKRLGLKACSVGFVEALEGSE